MLPLFTEYFIGHHRFKEHHRIVFIMALVAPACAVVFFQQLGWWNPWLWGCCGTGLSLALCLHSIVLIHGKPAHLSTFSKELIAKSDMWFPYFFVVIQSLIASLITMFIWFSISALVLKFPMYTDITVVILALSIPVRRYIWARMIESGHETHLKANEFMHGLWHVLISIFIARVIIGATVPQSDEPSGVNMWTIMVWIPALVYILFKIIATAYRLIYWDNPPPVNAQAKKAAPEEPVDRF